MLRRLIELFIGIALLVLRHYLPEDNSLKSELLGAALGTFITLSIDMIIWLISQRNFLLLRIACLKLWGRKDLRISMAYLYRIEVQGKYLLVKNQRFSIPTYQPVGGVYKYFHPEMKNFLIEIGTVSDTNIPNDNDSEYDLRLIMSKRIRLPKFLNWFFKLNQREIDPWREFYEELVAPGILPSTEFGYIYYELVGQTFEKIHFDPQFSIDTFKYADIFVPRYYNGNQEQALRNLSISAANNEFIWVTKSEIENGYATNGERIAPHTSKIFTNRKIKAC